MITEIISPPRERPLTLTSCHEAAPKVLLRETLCRLVYGNRAADQAPTNGESFLPAFGARFPWACVILHPTNVVHSRTGLAACGRTSFGG